MPHVPLFVSDKFGGKRTRAVRRRDRGDRLGVGEILEALNEHGSTNNTLVIFTSDNGPWLTYGNHAGSAGPLREGKGTTWEGGVRVPCIVRWPGKIPAGNGLRRAGRDDRPAADDRQAASARRLPDASSTASTSGR